MPLTGQTQSQQDRVAALETALAISIFQPRGDFERIQRFPFSLPAAQLLVFHKRAVAIAPRAGAGQLWLPLWVELYFHAGTIAYAVPDGMLLGISPIATFPNALFYQTNFSPSAFLDSAVDMILPMNANSLAAVGAMAPARLVDAPMYLMNINNPVKALTAGNGTLNGVLFASLETYF